MNQTYTAQPLGAVAVPLRRNRRCDRCGQPLAALAAVYTDHPDYDPEWSTT